MEKLKAGLLYVSRNILFGMIIGIANVIPGVSGGTMAFILGIYDQLTESIGEWLTNKDKRLNYTIFLTFIALGALLGILLFSKVFTFLLGSAFLKQPTYFFFGGLILGSMPVLIKHQEDRKPTPIRVGLFVLAAVLVIFTSLMKSGGVETGIPALTLGYVLWLGFCGFFALASMIVPGFSGSALLVSLGEYDNVLYFASNITDSLGYIAVFGIGGILGVLTVARLIDMALKKAPSATLYFIMGLVFASFYALGSEVAPVFSLSFASVSLSLVTFALGAGAALLVGRVNKE